MKPPNTRAGPHDVCALTSRLRRSVGDDGIGNATANLTCWAFMARPKSVGLSLLEELCCDSLRGRIRAQP
jgi:hypothetical protein